MQTTEVTNQQYRDMAQWAYDNGYVTATTSGLHDKLDGSTEFLKALGAGNYEISFSGGVFSCFNPAHPVEGCDLVWLGGLLRLAEPAAGPAAGVQATMLPGAVVKSLPWR